MAVELKDVQEVADALGKKFDEFKEKNDKRLSGLESEKAKLSETVDKLNGQLSELGELKTGLEAELKGLKRPGATGPADALKAQHKEAFMQFVRKGREDGLADLERKALNITADADGGFAVPEELDRTLLELMRDESPMRGLCNSVTVSGDYKKLVNIGGAGSGWVDEDDARPATGTPTLAALTPFMGELYANPQATQTSLDDIFFNAEQWISEEVAREFALQEALSFVSGDGTKKPKGFLAYAMATTGDKVRAFGTLQKVATAGIGAVSGDDLISLVHAMRKGYRQNAVWMMNNMSVFAIRLLKDIDNNYLWRPGLEAGASSSLLGYRIEENEDMPDVAASAKAIAFGDFKRGYTIVDRMGVRMLRDPYTNKPNVGFYTTKRVGGMVTDSNAIKVLEIKAA